MRNLLVAATLVALAWPANALDTTARDEAAALVIAVRADRAALAAVPGRDTRKAARLLKKTERTLSRLTTRYEDAPLDSRLLALFAASGRLIDGALASGALAHDSPTALRWHDCVEAALAEAEEILAGAGRECDRIVFEHHRAKVVQRLDAADETFAAAVGEERGTQRTLGAARALKLVEKAVRKVQRVCASESNVRSPAGVSVEGDRLTNTGRVPLTITDIRWDLTVTTSEGDFVSRLQGRLSAPALSHLAPLPIKLQRRDSVDGLEVCFVPQAYGRRVDGLLVWTTSAGTINVPLHLEQ